MLSEPVITLETGTAMFSPFKVLIASVGETPIAKLPTPAVMLIGEPVMIPLTSCATEGGIEGAGSLKTRPMPTDTET